MQQAFPEFYFFAYAVSVYCCLPFIYVNIRDCRT